MIIVFVIIFGFIGMLIFVWGKLSAEKRAIKNRRIVQGEKIWYVIPWPEADKKSWIEYMKNSTPVNLPLGYLDEWNEYLEEQE